MDALKSLINQTYKNFKLILVLDACHVNTKKMVQSFFRNRNDFNILIKEKNTKQGLAVAKNYGLSFVDTEYVAFLDADDLYEPTKIEKQIKFLQKNDVDFLGTQAWNILAWKRDVNTKYPSCFRTSWYNTHDQIKKAIFRSNPLTHGSMMIKMSCLKHLNFYRDFHPRGYEDWDLWQRAFKAGFQFHQLPQRLYVWCGGSSVGR
jgi:glycosyltransferase involved in cell wall biosynthesis